MLTLLENPNPKALSFSLGRKILQRLDAHDCSRHDSTAAKSCFPLAAAIMEDAEQRGIPIGNILIAKNDKGDDFMTLLNVVHGWNEKSRAHVLTFVEKYLNSAQAPILEHAIHQAAGPQFKDNRFEKGLKTVWNQVILPRIKAHGGDAQLKQEIVYDDNNVADMHVSIRGACSSGCGDTGIRKTMTLAKGELSKLNAFKDKNEGRTLGRIHVYDALSQTPDVPIMVL